MNNRLIRRNITMTEGCLISHDSVGDTVSIDMSGIRDATPDMSLSERAEIRVEVTRIMGELTRIREELDRIDGMTVPPWRGGIVLSQEELEALVGDR